MKQDDTNGKLPSTTPGSGEVFSENKSRNKAKTYTHFSAYFREHIDNVTDVML